MPVLSTIEIQAPPAGELSAEVAARLGNRAPLLRDLGEVLVNEAVDAFESETAPDGTAWAPLSPATFEIGYRRKTKKSPTKRVGKGARSGGGQEVPTADFARYVSNKKILQELGQRGGLLGSLAPRIGDDEVALTSNKPYALAHQYGLGARSSMGGRTFAAIPARPFAGLSETGRGVVDAIIIGWTRDALQG